VVIDHEGSQNSNLLNFDPNDKNSKIDVTQFKQSGDGRYNILVVGVGGAGHAGGNLTDSIQVVSLDPVNDKISITSIPRDLYVTIPGKGKAKINTAYSYAEAQKKGSGPLVAKKVVGEVIGVNISNFVLIDFNGVKELVNALGGVEVNVPEAINDPSFPCDNLKDYCAFTVKAGLQKMDGKTALRYSRSRKTTSDFDRSARQQLVLTSLKKKALSLGVLSNPVKISNLMSVVGDNLKTDMQINEIKTLMAIIKDIPDSSTTSHVLDTNTNLGLLKSSNDPLAGYISYPTLGIGKYQDVTAWFHKNSPDPFIKRENASITVVGGGSATDKQVKDFIDTLKDYGYNAQLGSSTISKSKYRTTQLFETSRKKYPISRSYLGTYLKIEAQDGAPLKSGSDFEIIYIPESTK